MIICLMVINWMTPYVSFRKCLVIFPHTPETSEQITEKMRAEELELVEEVPEITLTEEQAITNVMRRGILILAMAMQVELLVTDAGEMEEGLAEELGAQLLKPTLLFAFRKITGTIDPGENTKYEQQ